MLDKTDKLLRLTKKLTEDVKVIKTEHESRIAHLEKNVEELKGNLRGLVEIRKEAMNSSEDGLKKVNEKYVVMEAQPISIIPPSATRSNKKNLETSSQGVGTQVVIDTIDLSRNIIEPDKKPPIIIVSQATQEIPTEKVEEKSFEQEKEKDQEKTVEPEKALVKQQNDDDDDSLGIKGPLDIGNMSASYLLEITTMM
ncbi:uncharacterized protein LOC131876720 [Cryptomeria japonica]|uniref:uncharacterized protein LOC131876720 n=1 Tax=Cryptomeria japonica TaxID=3369 RepID=UPI0027DA3294|nr:uncharacterized protein LOC131876720 [Cryptomeria japonica]